jgi:hypothetical protein
VKQEVGLRRKHSKVRSDHSGRHNHSEGQGGSECEGEGRVANGRDTR